MASNFYLAIDIGASSGRVLSGFLNSQREIVLEELHRFENGIKPVGAYQCWDVANLLRQILTGLQKAKQKGITKCTLGIDTWGVDYCLIDAENKLVGQAIAYRDQRTADAIEKFAKLYSLAQLYEKTGIQLQPFNTLFQLFSETSCRLQQADKLLLMPDYLNFCLTGKKFMERTNASTTQLLNIKTGELDNELLHVCGIDPELFPPLIDAGTIIGSLATDSIKEYDLPVVEVMAVASHDTASAVLGVPGSRQSQWAFLSSGTWSLLGIESRAPVVNAATFSANYTNERGVDNTTRLLKNIMGMWLIQEVARKLEQKFSFEDLATLAGREPPFQCLINVNDQRFLNPPDMVAALQNCCEETGQKVAGSPGQLARAIYDNLALCYAYELEQLSRLTGKTFEVLHVVGGGSRNRFLNQLTANVAQTTVVAGPVEATALGNIMMQMIGKGELTDVDEARSVLKRSFPAETFIPRKIDAPLDKYYKLMREGV